MSLLDRKIPILTGINDTPSTTGQANHPNASLLCKNYNDLIDGELTTINTAIATIPTTATIRQAITVQGNATYNNETGVITVSNADFAVDHISLTNTVGLAKTYTIYADLAETITLGTFTITDGTNGTNGTNGSDGINGSDGADGQDGRNIESVTSIDNGNGTKTITFWGDLAETINLGEVILASGVDGVDGADGQDGVSVDHISLTATNGLVKTYTAWGDVGETINMGTFDVTDGTNGTNGTNGVSPTVTVLTQSAYNALGTYDSNTFYVING